MKPRLFIGSSREALSVAEAIHQALAHEAECLVWRDSFAIGGTTLGSLIATASNIDFAAFVFADDDTVELRGEKYLIARDNVIYELGLFTGHLSPDRCFFVLPDSIRIHIPSDLAGVTHGSYEVGRTDGNTKAAVAPFCSLLKSRITKLGFALKSVPNRLYDLAIKFECADWVNPIDARVRQKQSIVTEMITEIRQNPVDKLLLLKQQRFGFYVLLAAAIQARPSSDDDNLNGSRSWFR
jgi:hypothetical protein